VPISTAFVVLGILLAGYLVYRLSRHRKKPAGHRG
jgi:hypothetical protein